MKTSSTIPSMHVPRWEALLCNNLKPQLFPTPVSTYGISSKDYASDGIYTSHQHIDTSPVYQVGVVCMHFPYWALSMSHSTFTLRWIITLQDDYLPHIKKRFPTISVYSSSNISNCQLHSVDIIGFNGKFPVQPLSTQECTFVLFDYRFQTRKPWPQWYFRREFIKHAVVGGVTSFEGHVTIGVTTLQHQKFPIAPPYFTASPATYLNSILSCTNKGACCPPPLVKSPSQCVINIGRGLIHHNGLLPFNNRSIHIACPSVFTSTKWAKRPLTTKELALALDVSPSPYPLPHDLLLTCKVPHKVLMSVVNKLFLAAPLCSTGGIVLFLRLDLRCNPMGYQLLGQ